MMGLRGDLRLIADLIPEGSRVLDLGCGDGELLRNLMTTKGCTGTGVEIEGDEYVAALRSGVNVIHLDLDSQLDEFSDDAYDFVVLSRTLQNVAKPREVLQHIARIALHSVVSMPNFALWRNRLRLLRGRMPMSKDLPFEWYDTPNLHYTTLPELEALFEELDLKIDRRVPLSVHGKPLRLPGTLSNLTAGSAIYLLHARR